MKIWPRTWVGKWISPSHRPTSPTHGWWTVSKGLHPPCFTGLVSGLGVGKWLLPSPNNMTCHCQPRAVTSATLSLPKRGLSRPGADSNGGTWSSPADGHRPGHRVAAIALPHFHSSSLCDVTLQALLQWPLNDNFQGGKLNGRFFKTSLCRIPACARYYYFKRRTAVFVSCCSYYSETQTPFYAEKIPDSLELKATILNLQNFELTAKGEGKDWEDWNERFRLNFFKCSVL